MCLRAWMDGFRSGIGIRRLPINRVLVNLVLLVNIGDEACKHFVRIFTWVHVGRCRH
jgi:hypothetical protein